MLAAPLVVFHACSVAERATAPAPRGDRVDVLAVWVFSLPDEMVVVPVRTAQTDDVVASISHVPIPVLVRLAPLKETVKKEI